MLILEMSVLFMTATSFSTQHRSYSYEDYHLIMSSLSPNQPNYRYILQTDGGCRGGLGGGGAILFKETAMPTTLSNPVETPANSSQASSSSPTLEELWRGSFWLGKCDALEAEYRALAEALLALRRLAAHTPIAPLHIQCDSLAIVRNLRSGSDSGPQPMHRLNNFARSLLSSLHCSPHIHLHHISREHNCLADALATQAIASRQHASTPSLPSAQALLLFRLHANESLYSSIGSAYSCMRMLVEVAGVSSEVHLDGLWKPGREEAMYEIELMSTYERLRVTLNGSVRGVEWSAEETIAVNELDDKWRYLSVQPAVQTHRGALEPVVMQLALIPLTGSPDHLHSNRIVRDAAVFRSVLQTCLRNDRINWLCRASTSTGPSLLETVLSIGDLKACRQLLALADEACFCSQDVATTILQLIRTNKLTRAQTATLNSWLHNRIKTSATQS